MTSETSMKPHSHGAGADGEAPAHPSRGDRPTSFNLDDIPVPKGREEDWRFTPTRRIDTLFDPDNYDRAFAPVEVRGPQGVTVENAARDDDRVGTVLAPGDRTAVVEWNVIDQATVVTIPDGAQLQEPVYIDIRDLAGVRAQHLCLKVGTSAQATVIISHTGSADAFVNQGIEIDAADNAQLTVASLQEWDDSVVHAANHRIRIGRDAQVRHIVVTLGGSLVRICSDTDFAGPGGQLTMLGLYFVDTKQHFEHRVFVDHSEPHCYSRVSYKGALQGKDAHSVWVGDCLIREKADGTDTYELNRNLVLTEGAKADSVPNLEIENGEIAGAGHASATGRFDDEQLFYLMSRGIAEGEARRLVVRGFFAELIKQIEVPVIEDHLMASIEAELSHVTAPIISQ